MKTKNNSSHQWNEIVFRDRNKTYGAYDLRETYDVRIVRALILSFAFITSVITAPLIISHYFSKAIEIVSTKDFIFAPTQVEQQINKPILPKARSQQNTSHPKENMPMMASNDSSNTKPQIDTVATMPADNSLTADAGLSNKGIGSAPATESSNTGVTIDPTPVRSAWEVDQMPEFPGGTEGFYSFLRKHVTYPPVAREEGVQGTVHVSFVINAEGEVTNVKLLHGAGYGFDEEAMQVIHKMPKWKPGIYHGEQVSTSMVLPVKFVLMK